MDQLKFIGGIVVGMQKVGKFDQVAIQKNTYLLPDGKTTITRYQYERDPRLLASRPTVNVPIGSFFE